MSVCIAAAAPASAGEPSLAIGIASEHAVVPVLGAGPGSAAINQADTVLQAIRRQPEWETLRRQIIAQAIHFTDDLVFDFRLMLTQGSNVEIAGRLMWQLIRPFAPDVIVGPGFGAAPLLFSISLAALRDGVNLQVLMVRDKRKEHNQKKWIEGQRAPAGARAVMIDDFMSEGSALPLVEKALKADKVDLRLQALVLFFDMWQPLGSRQISTGLYPVVSLFRRHDIGLSRDCFDAKPPLMKGRYPDFIAQPMWWRFALNDKTGYPHKCVPVIADNAVFVADDHCRVWRHDARTGDIDWCYESLDDPFKGIVQMLQYADGSLVFGCYDGTVTRLNAATGEVIWRWRQDSSVHATPQLDIANDRLFIATEQWNSGKPFGHLQALDWRTGRLIWTHAHAYWPPGSPAFDVDSQTVISSCNDQSLTAVDAKTGALLWVQKTKGLVRGKPAVTHGLAVVATEAGSLQAFNIADGSPAWTARYGRGERHQFVHAQDKLVYALDGKWHLTAFDALTGQIKWLSRLRSPGCWCPVPMGRYLVVLSREGHLAVFDPVQEIKVWEGKVKGQFHQPGSVGVATQADGARQAVFAAASNNNGLRLFAINPEYIEGDDLQLLDANSSRGPGKKEDIEDMKRGAA